MIAEYIIKNGDADILEEILVDCYTIKKPDVYKRQDTDQSVFSPCKREQSHIQGCKASDG